MGRLTSVKIKTGENSYSQQIPISVLADNVFWNSETTLSQILGAIRYNEKGDIQSQINSIETYINQHNNDAAITSLSDQLIAARADIQDYEHASLEDRLDSDFIYTSNEIDKLNEFLLYLIKASSVDYLEFTQGYYSNNGKILSEENTGRFRIQNTTIPKVDKGDCFYIKEPYEAQIYIYDSQDINESHFIDKITSDYSSGIFFIPEEYYGYYATIAVQKSEQNNENIQNINDYVLYCSPRSKINQAYSNLRTLTNLDNLNNVDFGVSYYNWDSKPENAPTAKPIRIFTIKSEEDNQNAVSQFGICDGALYYRSKDWYSMDFSDWKSIGLGAPIYQDEQIAATVTDYYAKWQDIVDTSKVIQINLGPINTGNSSFQMCAYKLALQKNSISFDKEHEVFSPINYDGRVDLYKRPRILIIGGTYGDEKSSPADILKIAKMLLTREHNQIACKFDWYFIPILNPWGYNNEKRLNYQGQNLELDWSDERYTSSEDNLTYQFTSPQLQAIKGYVLEQIKPTVVINLQQEEWNLSGNTSAYCCTSVPVDSEKMNNDKYSDIISKIFTSIDIANANTDTIIAKWQLSNQNTQYQVCKAFECPPTVSCVNYFSGKIGNTDHLSIKTPYSFIIKTDPICQIYSKTTEKYNPIARTISLTYIWNIIKQIVKLDFSKEAQESVIITSLEELTDTEISNPLNDQILSYDSNSNKWINKTVQFNSVVDGQTNINVDSELSSTSLNPVQNKVLYEALDKKADKKDIPHKLSDLYNDLVIIPTHDDSEEQAGTLTISEATVQTAGLMSPDDKILLNDLSAKYDSIINGFDVEDNIVVNNGTLVPYIGEKVSLNVINKAKCYYQFFRSTSGDGTSWQGMDVHGKYLFRSKTGGKCYVYDLSQTPAEGGSITKIAQFDFGSAKASNHAGVLSFTDIYLGADEFPLLLISDGSSNPAAGYCYIERIVRNGNSFQSTLRVNITLNVSSFYIWTQWHYYNGYLYAFGHKYKSDGTTLIKNNRHILTKFNFPSLSLPVPSLITLTEADIVEQWEMDYHYNYMQGCRFYNDKIFATYGHGTASGYPNKIMVFSLISHEALAAVDLSQDNKLKDLQMEGCCIYNQKLLLGFNGSNNIYAFTFAQNKTDSVENNNLATQNSDGLMSAEDKVKLDNLSADNHYPPAGTYTQQVWIGAGSVVRNGRGIAFTLPVMGANKRNISITVTKITVRPGGVPAVSITPSTAGYKIDSPKFYALGIGIVIEIANLIKTGVSDPYAAGIQVEYNITFKN